jgi:hypothetical protein
VKVKEFLMRKLWVLAGICSFATVLSAAPLQIVNVSAPNINCFFNTNCTISGHDLFGSFLVPGTTDQGLLLSRTYVGQPGTPLAGYGAYIYRMDVTRLHSGASQAASIQSLTIPFGREIIARDYGHTGNTNGQVWVITHGGLGTANVASATATPTNITFVFNPPIRGANGTNAGQSSYFFGVVSTNITKRAVAQIKALVGTNSLTIYATNSSPVF